MTTRVRVRILRALEINTNISYTCFDVNKVLKTLLKYLFDIRKPHSDFVKDIIDKVPSSILVAI